MSRSSSVTTSVEADTGGPVLTTSIGDGPLTSSTSGVGEGVGDFSTTAMVGVGTAGIESSPHAVATVTSSRVARTTKRDTAGVFLAGCFGGIDITTN